MVGIGYLSRCIRVQVSPGKFTLRPTPWKSVPCEGKACFLNRQGVPWW